MASSSSGCPFDVFNPDTALRKLVSLSVEDAGGNVSSIPEGRVVLANGANVSFDIDDDEDVLTIAADPGTGIQDPYYTQKYEALASSLTSSATSAAPVAGPYGDASGDPWAFTTDSLWIGRIANVSGDPVTGAFFITNDVCLGVGEFEETAEGYPQDGSYPQLGILDICAPCLDCLTYQRLQEYLARITTFYNYIFELAYNQESTPPTHPDGGTPEEFSGTYAQFTALQRYWDHLVHNSTIKISAQGQGQSVALAAFYRNISDDTIGDSIADQGVKLTITLEFFQEDSVGTVTSWSGVSASTTAVRELQREGKDTASIPLGGVSFVSASEIEICLYSGADMVSGEEVYADVAVLFLTTALFNDETLSYFATVTLAVQPNHLGASPVERTTRVYLQPAEPPAESSSP